MSRSGHVSNETLACLAAGLLVSLVLVAYDCAVNACIIQSYDTPVLFRSHGSPTPLLGEE